MPGPRSGLAFFFDILRKMSEIYELRGGVYLYLIPDGILSAKASPGRFTVGHNMRLSSYKKINKYKRQEHTVNSGKEPLQEVFRSVTLLLDHYKMTDWLMGMVILTFANLLQIAITTAIEFGFRTVGATFMHPITLFDTLISESNANPTNKWLQRTGVFILFSPLWCIAQFVTWIADIATYSRQFFDAAVPHLFNPVWLATKLLEFLSRFTANPIESSKPTVNTVLRKFALSSVDLLLSLPVLITCLLAAGVSIPFFETSGLKTVGDILLPSTSNMGGAAAIWIYSGGMMAGVAKLGPGLVNAFDQYMVITRSENKRRSRHTTHSVSSMDSNVTCETPGKISDGGMPPRKTSALQLPEAKRKSSASTLRPIPMSASPPPSPRPSVKPALAETTPPELTLPSSMSTRRISDGISPRKVSEIRSGHNTAGDSLDSNNVDSHGRFSPSTLTRTIAIPMTPPPSMPVDPVTPPELTLRTISPIDETRRKFSDGMPPRKASETRFGHDGAGNSLDNEIHRRFSSSTFRTTPPASPLKHPEIIVSPPPELVLTPEQSASGRRPSS